MEIAKVNITHPEKVMYPMAGYTKADIANYYNFIAPLMLPYIKNRALSLLQFPGGIASEGYFHKHSTQYYPDYIKRFVIPTTHHGVIEMNGVINAKGLVYLSGQNTIEFHMSLAKANNLNNPDQIILDFDPSDNDFEKVRAVALIAKDILDAHKLKNYVKTTGSRGLHIHIPLNAKRDFAIIKQTALDLSHYIHEQCPEISTLEFRKNKRADKVFIDYLRNDYSATAIAPYSLRANPKAGIATPITWDEVKNNKTLKADTYNLSTIHTKVKEHNPWANFK